MVVVGVAGEGVELFAKKCFRKWHKKNKSCLETLEIIFWALVVLGLVVEMREDASTDNAVALLKQQMFEASTNLANADPRNHPITSISAVATFRIKGDFSPPPLPYSNLGEPTGAWISFVQGTNISDKNPMLSLTADAADISILNLIPNNEHPDTHDVVITFHDATDPIPRHFMNVWMWQNKAGFFDGVKGLMIQMRQIGSNVAVLSGNVVVTANDLKWEFPIPSQKQRLGVVSSKIIRNANNQDEAQVMPLDLMDFTQRPLGHFDGK